ASVTDSHSLTTTATVHVVVAARPAGNTEPLVTITAPTSGQALTTGVAATFAATATDLESGNLAAGLTWSSDRDGAIGTGATFTRILSQGTHQITAGVTDAGGLRGT